MNQNITIKRGHIAQISSFLGGIGLLTGLLGLIWQGSFTGYILAALGIGAAGIILWAIMTPDDFVGLITGRHVRQGTISIFSTLLLIGVVALVYIIVQREVIVADFTIDNRFTLSPETQELLEVVGRSPRPIEITAFYTADEIIQREIDDQYIQLYVAASDGKIRRNYVDPIAQPAFSERFMPYINQGIRIFVSFIDESTGAIDPATTLPVANSGLQESDLTEALARLLAQGRFKVYFETSLDTPDPIDNTQQGLSLINNGLRNQGLITEPLDLERLAAQGGRIPEDASAVIIARPRRQMNASMLEVLDAYLQRGGALFIAADVFFTDELFMGDDDPLNNYLWENYGLRMTDQVAVDPASSGQSALDVVSAAVFTDNPIGANINVEGAPETAVRFSVARAVEVDDDPPVANGRVIMTTPESWGESNLSALATRNEFTYDEDEDSQGPLTTVAWAYDADTNAKIVLVGDGDFMLNGHVQSPIGNGGLVIDSIAWMTGFTEEIRFEPRSYMTTPVLFVDGQTLDVIAFITVILMPGAALLLAGAIYVRRLRA